MRPGQFTLRQRRRLIKAALKSERASHAGDDAGRGAGDMPPTFPFEFQFHLGKTAAPINKGASGIVNVYFSSGTPTKGSETWNGTTTITAYNRFANAASGKWVICLWILGGWELIALEC